MLDKLNNLIAFVETSSLVDGGLSAARNSAVQIVRKELGRFNLSDADLLTIARAL